MQIFATRVWGFIPEKHPLIFFGRSGDRDKLLKDAQIGDRIVFVGTLGAPTLEQERGKILGMAEIGRRPVNTLDIIPKDQFENPVDFDEFGNFKWPKAIPVIKAWRFNPQPKLMDVVDKQLPYDATPRAILLSPAYANAILQIPTTEIHLPELPGLEQEKRLSTALSQAKLTKGPVPSSASFEVIKNLNHSAHTYALRFGKTNIWKIGHTIDIVQRLREINAHIPVEVLDQNWAAIYTHAWDNQVDAYNMEQYILEKLTPHRTQGERIQCNESVIWDVWKNSIGL